MWSLGGFVWLGLAATWWFAAERSCSGRVVATGFPLALAILFCKLSWEGDSFSSTFRGPRKQLPVPLSVSRVSSNRRHIVAMMDCRVRVNRGKET